MWTIPLKENSESFPTGRETYLTRVMVRLCSRSFPSLVPEIIQPGLFTIIKQTVRHHLPRGVPWLLCASQRDAIASIKHSSLSTSIRDSSEAVYLSDCSQTQLNTLTEQNTGSLCTAAYRGMKLPCKSVRSGPWGMWWHPPVCAYGELEAAPATQNQA